MISKQCCRKTFINAYFMPLLFLFTEGGKVETVWNLSLILEQILLEKSFLSLNKNPLNNPFPFYLKFGM